jgi:hypothetical protein
MLRCFRSDKASSRGVAEEEEARHFLSFFLLWSDFFSLFSL